MEIPKFQRIVNRLKRLADPEVQRLSSVVADQRRTITQLNKKLALYERRLSADERGVQIRDLLKRARGSGATFVPVSRIDSLLLSKKPGVFLKHDVHNVSPAKLVRLARDEAEIGISGTYFFMSFGHPRSEGFFSPADQRVMMKEIAALGHEIGAHVDVLYDIRHRGRSLHDCIYEQLEAFSEVSGDLSVANLHGNTSYKITDVHGNNVIYDLFDELGKQLDYPTLKNLTPEVAGFIRANRLSLSSLPISHWGDSWIWSKTNGLIATNWVSDNSMAKQGGFAVAINLVQPCAYGLGPSPSTAWGDGLEHVSWVSLNTTLTEYYRKKTMRFGIAEEATTRFFDEALPTAPFVMLLHPEFYAI
jgi:hypothetical protein